MNNQLIGDGVKWPLHFEIDFEVDDDGGGGGDDDDDEDDEVKWSKIHFRIHPIIPASLIQSHIK